METELKNIEYTNSITNINTFYIVSALINYKGQDVLVSHYHNLNSGQSGLEYYQGPNYVLGSTNKSYSRNYKETEIPNPLKEVYSKLKELHQNNWK